MANRICVVWFGLAADLPKTFCTFQPIANGIFNHMTDYFLCKHKRMAMEDNTENDNDFHDSKSDRRLTGRTSVVGYVIKNMRRQIDGVGQTRYVVQHAYKCVYYRPSILGCSMLVT
jgi:hypothetical protein